MHHHNIKITYITRVRVNILLPKECDIVPNIEMRRVYVLRSLHINNITYKTSPYIHVCRNKQYSYFDILVENLLYIGIWDQCGMSLLSQFRNNPSWRILGPVWVESIVPI
jgi:hypothetical protein